MNHDIDSHRIRFTPEVSLGAILQALIVAGGVAVYAITTSTRATDTESSLKDFKVEIGHQIDALHTEMNRRFDVVGDQIGALPDYRARLDQAERRLNGHDAALGALDARMGVEERLSIQTRSDLDSILPASRAKLPGDRGR